MRRPWVFMVDRMICTAMLISRPTFSSLGLQLLGSDWASAMASPPSELLSILLTSREPSVNDLCLLWGDLTQMQFSLRPLLFNDYFLA